MTEEEAKTKACCGPPAVAIATLIAAGQVLAGDHGRCMASACMAWREQGQWRVRSDKPWRLGRPSGDDQGPNNETRSWGYCGLAGGPNP